MNIQREAFDKIEGLRLAGLRDVLITANRTDFGDDDTDSPTHGYDLGVKHGVHMLTDRILEEYGFERAEVEAFYRYAKALESEDPPQIVG